MMEIMGTLLRLSERAGLRWWLVSSRVYTDIEVNERKIRVLVIANKNFLDIFKSEIKCQMSDRHLNHN